MRALEAFVAATRAAVSGNDDEAFVLEQVTRAMLQLVATDGWLPPELAVPDAKHYRQYLLHRDPMERFSVVSFVWGPGQATPVHDHTTWGVIGMLRGCELSQRYRLAGGKLETHGPEERLHPGEVTAVSPRIGDVHRVRNGFDDRVSISIHAYGADIGKVRRHVFDPATGCAKEFVSGYSNAATA